MTVVRKWCGAAALIAGKQLHWGGGIGAVITLCIITGHSPGNNHHHGMRRHNTTSQYHRYYYSDRGCGSLPGGENNILSETILIEAWHYGLDDQRTLSVLAITDLHK